MPKHDSETKDETEKQEHKTQNKAKETLVEKVEVVYLSKITMRHIGKPKLGATIETGQRHFVGKIGGTAVSIRKEKLPDGEESYSLCGAFVARRDNGDIIRSGRLFLPKGVHEMLGETIAASDGPVAIKFAYDVFTVPAANQAGYSYELLDLLPVVRDEAMQLILPDDALRIKHETSEETK